MGGKVNNEETIYLIKNLNHKVFFKFLNGISIIREIIYNDIIIR